MIQEKIYSVMFHHFHDDFHKPCQGSLSHNNFKKMIEWINTHYSLIGAEEFMQKFENNILKSDEVCLSFDDALKCQYDIAMPILEQYGLDAFFFVYSSLFDNKPSLLEIYRYFRTTCFEDINDFYNEFFKTVKNYNPTKYLSHHLIYEKSNYLSSYPFYSNSDKWFRYLRDNFLEVKDYDAIMNKLMIKRNFDMSYVKQILFMTEKDLIDIYQKGHEIGLHSYSHPTQMKNLNKNEQELEYKKNYKHLNELIGEPISSMSHPCGSYNQTTLKILSELNIKIGFRSSLYPQNILTSLELPREDQANIQKKMNQ